MKISVAILSVGALFVAFSAYLVYSGAIGLWTGLSLLGFIASVAGMLKCLGMKGGKTFSSALFVLALGFVGLFVWQSGVLSGGKVKGPDLKLDVFEIARANVFGRKLVELAPNSKVLLLVGHVRENEALIKAQVQELKKVFGADMDIAAQESFPVERLKGVIPRYGLTKAVKAKDFEAAILKHKDCGLVVSLVGLPREFWKLGIWRWNELARPKMAFLEGEPRVLSSFARKGQICLFAAYQPGWTYVPETPSDPEKAFAMRYLLVGAQGVCKVPAPKPDDMAKTGAVVEKR